MERERLQKAKDIKEAVKPRNYVTENRSNCALPKEMQMTFKKSLTTPRGSMIDLPVAGSKHKRFNEIHQGKRKPGELTKAAIDRRRSWKMPDDSVVDINDGTPRPHTRARTAHFSAVYPAQTGSWR